MSESWEGGYSYENKKPQLELKGKTVIEECKSVYDGSIPTTFRRETILHFKSEDQAAEYYYKKR